jgi:protein lifeguard
MQTNYPQPPKYAPEGEPHGMQSYPEQNTPWSGAMDTQPHDEVPVPRQSDFEVDSSLSNHLSKNSQLPFIRKVYGILFTQLAVTALWIAVVSANRETMVAFLAKRVELLVLAIVGQLVTLYALGCYKEIARSVPLNYCLLGVFTICMSYLSSFTTVQFDPKLVLAAGVITAGMVLGLTVYAIQTKDDYTHLGAFMFLMSFALLFGCILFLFIRTYFLYITITVLTVILLGIFIIYDTQLIFSGHSHQFTIDDYVFAAMVLYIDIIRLFLEVLKLLGALSKK